MCTLQFTVYTLSCGTEREDGTAGVEEEEKEDEEEEEERLGDGKSS